MPQYPFPPPGPGAEEPPGPAPLPGHGNGPQDHAAGPAPRHDSTERDGKPADGDPADPANPEGPDGGWGEVPPGGPEQGLFICLPAENMELSRFAGEDGCPAMPPGPLLAGVAAAVAGGDGSGLAGVSEDFLFAVISGGRRMASWGTWLEFSAMRELALRHPAVPRRLRGAGPAAPGTHPDPDPARVHLLSRCHRPRQKGTYP